MKKILLLLLAIQPFTGTFSQKKGKPNFGIEMGFTVVGMDQLTRAGNPLIQANESLKKNIGFTGGAFAEYIGTRKKKNGTLAPGWGIKVKATYSFSEAYSESFTTDETISLGYMQVPLLFKICLGSGEVNVSSHRSDDTYEVRRKSGNEYEITHHPGQFTPGYRTTRSFFLYFGPQMGFVNNVGYNAAESSYETAFETKKQNIEKSYLSYIGGMELWVGRIYLDLSYQVGQGSIYKGSDVALSGFTGKFGIAF